MKVIPTLLHGDIIAAIRAQVPKADPTDQDKSDEAEPPMKKRRVLDDYDDDDDDQPCESNEIQSYLNCQVGPCTEILQWWREHQAQFPQLSKVAKNIRCVQASSAPSERNFSIAGNVVSKRRCALRPHSVNDILFMNSNMK